MSCLHRRIYFIKYGRAQAYQSHFSLFKKFEEKRSCFLLLPFEFLHQLISVSLIQYGHNPLLKLSLDDRHDQIHVRN
uniref:Uncharacterized protein n=1 Tax=Rhizophora mucronata TaxID=61149 RepID=A0A2P2R091_RHIMU